MTAEAHDMSRYWRIISAEASNDEYMVYGVWWIDMKRESVAAIDVTIWDQIAQYGLEYGRELGYRGEVIHRPRNDNHAAVAEDAHDLIVEVCKSILSAELLPLMEES